jgi:hypothetical protein
MGNAAFDPEHIEQLEIKDADLKASLQQNSSRVQELVKEMYNNTMETKKNTEAIIGERAGESAGMLSGAYENAYDKRKAQYDAMVDNIQRTEDYDENEDITNFINQYDKTMGTDYGKKLSIGTNDV